jgi:uncharacterized protein (DUF1778 family)
MDTENHANRVTPASRTRDLYSTGRHTVSQSVYYTAEEWQLVQDAAKLEQISRSGFVATAAIERAREILSRHAQIQS